MKYLIYSLAAIAIFLLIRNPDVLMGIYTDYPFRWSNLLFLIPPFAKAYVDVFLFEKRGIDVNHKASMAVTLLVASVFVYIDSLSGVNIIRSGLLAAGYFFLTFDYIRNIFAGKSIEYIDDGSKEDSAEDSWWDRKVYSKMTPLVLLFVKCWVFISALGLYYLSSLIV